MKRINLYTLIIVTVLLFLFCLAAVNANAQEADSDESLITRLGELIYMAQFDALPTEYGVHSVQGDPESGEILIFYETRGERPLYVIERWHGCEFRGSSDWMAAEG